MSSDKSLNKKEEKEEDMNGKRGQLHKLVDAKTIGYTLAGALLGYIVFRNSIAVLIGAIIGYLISDKI